MLWQEKIYQENGDEKEREVLYFSFSAEKEKYASSAYFLLLYDDGGSGCTIKSVPVPCSRQCVGSRLAFVRLTKKSQ